MYHTVGAGEAPWCTAAWVPLTATTDEQAIQARRAACGDARLLDELPVDGQLDAIEIGGICSARRP